MLSMYVSKTVQKELFSQQIFASEMHKSILIDVTGDMVNIIPELLFPDDDQTDEQVRISNEKKCQDSIMRVFLNEEAKLPEDMTDADY